MITSQAAVLDLATHKAYVVDTQKDSVSVVGSTSVAINVGRGPIALALNAVTHRVYVANHGSGTVSVIDGKSDQVIATIPVDAPALLDRC